MNKCYICGKKVEGDRFIQVQCDMCTARKIIFLENLERDTEIQIKNRVDYNTAMQYRKTHPQPKREHAFLASLSPSAGPSTVKQPNGKGVGKGSGLKRVERGLG